MDETQKTIRLIYFSDEYSKFYESLDIISQNKVDRIINYIITNKLLSQNFIKKLKDSNENPLYEIIVTSTSKREFRILSIGIINNGVVDNIIDAEEILLLNGFLKKSNKDYKSAIKKANKIIDDFLQ